MSKPLALIIEDDNDVSRLYKHVLETHKFDTEVLRSGEVALSRLAVSRPALMLLDLNLTDEVSGVDILQEIRGQKHLADMRIIIVTGHADMARALQDEADLVLIKPVDVDELGSFVDRMRPLPI
jgi:DNA-binding response OmpR family regulator